MINHTFRFLEGLNYTTERNLMQYGIKNWNDFISAPHIPGFSQGRKDHCDRMISLMMRHLELKNHEYFALNLPCGEHWRLYEIFKDDICYLDIETTGLSPQVNSVTTVSIWDGKKIKTLIQGKNLSTETIIEMLSPYKMVVTFNGTTFDLPFLFSHYPKAKKIMLHYDLRWACRKVGIIGGLKRIEKQMGISRELADVDGAQAVKLWRRWKIHNDSSALKTLVKYNQEDVINLEQLSTIVYTLLSKKEMAQLLGNEGLREQ